MNKERILGLIRNPDSLSYDTDMPLVKELIEAFPFYAAPHALMAKLHYDQKSIYFDKHLRLCAGYIGDRELLYELLHGNQNDVAVLVEEEVSEMPVQVQPENGKQKEEKKEKPAEFQGKTPEHAEEQKADAELASLTDPPVAVHEKLLDEPAPANEKSPEPKEEQPAPVKAAEQEKAAENTKQHTAAALSVPSFASYDYFAYYEKVLKKTDEESGRPTLNLDVSKQENEEKSQPVSIPEYTLSQKENETSDARALSFSGWLDRLKGPAKDETIKPEKALPEKKEAAKEADKNAGKPYKAVPVDEIISNFIAQEPRIKPKPSRFYSPEDMARQSAEHDMSLATETLAEIYLKQGLTEKAIEIYRELSTRYPLKSSYFAAKIKEIKPH